MRSTRSALNFSFLLVVLAGCALAWVTLLHGDFLAHNIIFNTIIAVFDVVVILYGLVTFLFIARGMTQWRSFEVSFPRDAEPKLVGGMRLFRGRLKDLISFDESERSAVVDLLSKALGWRVDFLYYAAGIVISMGLLGTFYGLTLTMEGIRTSIEALSTTDEINAKLLVNSLAVPLGGMATAFSSSMFGLASSILLSFMAYFFSRASEGWVYEVEKWSFVAGEDNAANLVGSDEAQDVTVKAINRLAGVFSRHVGFAKEESEKLVSVTNTMATGQIAQQESLRELVGLVAGHNVAIERLTTQMVESAERVADSNERAVEVIERNNSVVAQSVADVSQIRVQFSSGVEGLLGKLLQIEQNTQSINQNAARLVSGGNEQGVALDTALNALRAQQEAVMESMRELTQARVSIVSAVQAAQSSKDKRG